ncbi:hypothetical protein WISP_67712 [Willisornis vidua]|uniref:Rna-directed dna polymerase from mobile element jockey-like n=1 Tax=Willisornis vidua TaxID=1566151 RepID=A0ABQ9DCZ6_9PASS|nr:hypothetical protein WISP_67712 [Willisornis vidua]
MHKTDSVCVLKERSTSINGVSPCVPIGGQSGLLMVVNMAKAEVPSGKLYSTQLDKHLMRWVSNLLMDRAQRVTVNRVTSEWGPVTSGVSQGSTLGPVLVNIFINDLDVGLEGILSKSADVQGGGVDCIKSREALQRDLDKLEGWAITNHLVKFHKGKCWILHLGWGNPACLYGLGNEMLESSAMERDLGYWSMAN